MPRTYHYHSPTIKNTAVTQPLGQAAFPLPVSCLSLWIGLMLGTWQNASWQQVLGWHSWDALFLLQFLPPHIPLPLLFPTYVPAKRQKTKGNNGKGWASEAKNLSFKYCFYPFRARDLRRCASPFCTLVSSFIIILLSSQVCEVPVS